MASKSKSKHKRRRMFEQLAGTEPPVEPLPASGNIAVSLGARTRWIAGLLLGLAFLWAYWPTLVELVNTWETVPDYSHGFLVGPLALYFAWARRSQLPELKPSLGWWGLALIVLSVAMRSFGAAIHWAAFDGWSILPWVAGVIWLLAGGSVLRWSLPSVVFLLFMVPAPFRVERWLSLPLQTVATHASCFVLQLLGRPAFSEGNIILLGDYELEVAQACCGLRIFLGIVALAFAFAVLTRGSWWLRLAVILSSVPVALASNVIRIVTTALLYESLSSEKAQKLIHDMAGWLTIPLAAAMLAALVWYFGNIIRPVTLSNMRSMLQDANEAADGAAPA